MFCFFNEKLIAIQSVFIADTFKYIFALLNVSEFWKRIWLFSLLTQYAYFLNKHSKSNAHRQYVSPKPLAPVSPVV